MHLNGQTVSNLKNIQNLRRIVNEGIDGESNHNESTPYLKNIQVRLNLCNKNESNV